MDCSYPAFCFRVPWAALLSRASTAALLTIAVHVPQTHAQSNPPRDYIYAGDRLVAVVKQPRVVPTLTPSTTSAGQGQSISVVAAGGPGNRTDWVGMYATSAGDTAWLDWKYLSNSRTAPATGVNGATLTFTLPAASGTYNFRFFSNDGYTKLATSATVDVAPAAVIGVNPAAVAFDTVSIIGGGFTDRTVTVTNIGVGTLVGNGTVAGPGFSAVGVTSYSLAAGESAVLTLRFAPTTAGAASGSLSLTGGGGATVPLTGTGVNTPALSVSTVATTPSTQITVTLSGGPGNPTDWIGMYTTSAADITFLDWNYLNGSRTPPAVGLTSATLTFTLPATSGTYNFRFFSNGGFTKLATSATVTVTVPPQLGIAPASVAFDTVRTGFSVDRTVTVTNTGGGTLVGSGLVSGTGFSAVGSMNYSLGAGQSAVLTVRFTPAATGNATGSLVLSGGGGGTVSLSGIGVATPALSVSSILAAPGQTLTVNVTGGPGNATDWIGLHDAGATDSVYLDWKYLNGTRTAPASGSTSAAVTFTVPSAVGTYNFRFFQSNSYTKLATSATVTVALHTTLGVSPASLAFDTVSVGSSVDRVVTITNLGSGLVAGIGTVSGMGFGAVGTTNGSNILDTAGLGVYFDPGARAAG